MDFTQIADSFDTPRRRERASIVAHKIQEYIGNGRRERGMEYGCGTGLVGFFLVDMSKELVLVDPSPGMIAQVEMKRQASSLSNVTSLCGNILSELVVLPSFDCIFASMALHHESHVLQLFIRLFTLINEGGCLVIVDLDTDDGSFHADEAHFTGHHGFRHDYLLEVSIQAGFSTASVETFYYGEREVLNKQVPYSLFILCAEKGPLPNGS